MRIRFPFGCCLSAAKLGNRWALFVKFLSFVALVILVSIFYRQTIVHTICGQSKLEQHTILPRQNEFVSNILHSRGEPKKKSGNYIMNLRFGHELWTDRKPLLTGPVMYQPTRKTAEDVRRFLARERLIETPFDTDGLSPYLNGTRQVIAEAQRIHLNVFADLFHGKKYALLFQVPHYENRGDLAIAVGEMVLLEKMGIKLVHTVLCNQNTEAHLQTALTVARNYSQQEVVVLLQGGGNIFGYSQVDQSRAQTLKYFSGYDTVLLSESMYMSGSREHLQAFQKLYCCNPRLTIVLRDRLSLQIARRLFTGSTRLLLAPDMAFNVGALARNLPPFFDIAWLRREDKENPEYSSPPRNLLPPDLTLLTFDWLRTQFPRADNVPMQMANGLENGLSHLQTGRVLVTDRLHGHILSTLLDIPHVLLDNADNKLSSYHNTWTRGLANCRLASTPREAAQLALDLLNQYRDELPLRITAADPKP